MDLLKLGRQFLFFGLALTTALLISLQILDLHSPGENTLDPFSLQYEVNKDGVRASVNHIVRDFRYIFVKEDAAPVLLSNPELRQALISLNGSGRPFAYLSFHNLYVINSSGKILGLADSVAHRNLPLITLNEFLVNPKKYKVMGEKVAQVLELIKDISNINPVIYSQLSEVNVNKNLGIVAYMDWARGIPVILGSGSLQKKLTYLDAFYKKWGTSKLINQTRYIDLRVDGKIILNKSV